MILLLCLGAGASTLEPPRVVEVIDFGVSDGGWLSAGQTGQWEWGVPTSGPGGVVALWATDLTGNYLNDTVDTLTSPALDLSGVAEPTLVVHHWYTIASPDLGWLEVDDGTGFSLVTPINGYPQGAGFGSSSGTFVDHVFDLAGFGLNPRVKLVFSADATIADDGWYVSSVTVLDGDGSAPVIQPASVPGDSQDVDGPYLVSVTIAEEGQLSEALLHWEVEGVETVSALVPLPGNVWTGWIPGVPLNSVVRWWVTACDESWESRFPLDDADEFRVFLAAPTGLERVNERAVGQTVALTWAAPISPEVPLNYEIWRDDALLLEVGGPPADAPVSLPLHTFQVRALYPSGSGDLSEPLVIEAEIPVLTAVTPDAAWPGDTVRVRVTGESWYLDPVHFEASLGGDVEVRSQQIEHADAAELVIAVADDALPGPRALLLETVWGTSVFPDAFTVADPATAPRILEVSPSVLKQRTEAVLEVTASEPFAGAVAVNGGSDLVITRPAEVDGSRLSVGIAVVGDAHLGTHTLVFDDGLRLWTATVEVTERVIVPPAGCAQGGALGTGGAVSAAAALALGLRRRKESRW